MTIETYDGKAFDWSKHHKAIYDKYQKFIKDFELQEYIDFKGTYEKNPCKTCHSMIGEPSFHYKAKKKIFDLFVDDPNYLVCTELQAEDPELQVFDKGLRAYQFDILIINVKNLARFFDYVQTSLGTNYMEHSIREIEHDIIFCVEVDGKDSHSFKKDQLRDKFFLDTYNVVTMRYGVSDLVQIYVKYKGRFGRRQMSNYTKIAVTPTLQDIEKEDVILDVRSLYYKRYQIFKHHIPLYSKI